MHSENLEGYVGYVFKTTPYMWKQILKGKKFWIIRKERYVHLKVPPKLFFTVKANNMQKMVGYATVCAFRADNFDIIWKETKYGNKMDYEEYRKEIGNNGSIFQRVCAFKIKDPWEYNKRTVFRDYGVFGGITKEIFDKLNKKEKEG